MKKQHPITYEHIGMILLALFALFILGSAISFWMPIEKGAKELKELYDETLELEKVVIGYMECWNDDGTGPIFECGDQKVVCWSKRGGEKRVCPFFENIYKRE